MINMRNMTHVQEEFSVQEYAVTDIAVFWILEHCSLSNFQLAVMSNVCKKWREIVTFHLKKHFQESLCSSRVNNNYIRRLLLPDMALEIGKRRLMAMGMTCPSLELDSPCFCVAWFHPRGIKIKTVDLSETFNDSSEEDKNEGLFTYKAHLRKIREEKIQQKSKSSSEFKTVADEWQGYQNAMDVLLPLGYSTAFVRDILDYAATFDFLDHKVDLVPSTKSANLSQMSIRTRGSITKPRRTTFAVRGTTFARPHGYCLCWAHEEEVEHFDSAKEESIVLEKSSDDYQMKLYKLKALKRREKRRRIRMRDSLPRTCLSTLAKNPDLQGPYGQLEGRRQRCIQFLNAERNRAVYMRTHPFDCGPIQAPVTMFLVGIATEDGCFVSGLRRRFELGHLYGKDSLDSIVEMSPICIATDSSKLHDSSLDCVIGSSPSTSNQSLYHLSMDSDDSSMSYDEEDDPLRERGDSKCQCKIQWKQKYGRRDTYDEDDDDDEDDDENDTSLHTNVDENRVIRGALGPGRWHLYTAIFDGRNSAIRVDGVDEPIQLPNNSSYPDEIPILDGLTIGSDHLFDMSLCFGEGSEGEGQGSIAELAVFKGSLDRQDVCMYEQYLMKKHGILHGSFGYGQDTSNFSPFIKSGMERCHVRKKPCDQWEENKWIKDVHLLMSQSPPCSPSVANIPLRMVARHRSVAWQRCCDVTGKPLRVSRIGSKLSNGSSDW
jgi:hypothetical protein